VITALVLALLLLAGCGCPTERVSPLRGFAEVEGQVHARMDATADEKMGAACGPAAGVCWFDLRLCDVRGIRSVAPVGATSLPTWLRVDCHAAGALAIPLPDLRSAEGAVPLDVPLVRGALAGYHPDPATTAGRALGFPTDPTCPASAWPDGTRFVGELRILDRAGGPAGPDTLVTPDFRLAAELVGRVVAGPGPACAVPDFDFALRFTQTPYEYATVGERCE
jgi:hypothetical protein